MKEFIPVLRRSKLFSGVGEEDLTAMLGCLQATKRNVSKDEYVYRQGENLGDITILAKGRLHICRDDFWGNRSIIGIVGPGDIFGEAYASPDSGPLLNDVIAVEDSTVIRFDVRRLLNVCPSACRFHAMTVENLFYMVSEKNRSLVRKLGHMSRRTTREKLMSYLSDEAGRQRSNSFTIPFNRQQLADFLSVDRSAMSAELGRMKEEGLLTFEKNRFTLL